MLHEVELLIAGRGPEILAEDHLVVLLGVALLVHEKQTLLLAERRVGKDHGVFLAPRGSQAIMPGMEDNLVATD